MQIENVGEIVVARMDNAQLMSRIRRVVGFKPRAGQTKYIHKLIVSQRHLILTALTFMSGLRILSFRQFCPTWCRS